MRAPTALFAAIALGAGFSAAVSDACEASLTGLIANPDAQCLNAAAFVQLLVTQDVPAGVQNWLSGFCSIGECSPEALASVVANITSGGCREDLGDDPELQSIATTIVQTGYPTVRKVLCLKDTTSDLYCPTDALTKLSSQVPLTIDDFLSGDIFEKVADLPADAIPELVCTECVSSMYSVVNQELGDATRGYGVENTLTQLCGADFLSAGMGENIEETASTAKFSANEPEGDSNSAIAMLSPAVWILAAVSTIFTLTL